jgi:hypothetical protein
MQSNAAGSKGEAEVGRAQSGASRVRVVLALKTGADRIMIPSDFPMARRPALSSPQRGPCERANSALVQKKPPGPNTV